MRLILGEVGSLHFLRFTKERLNVREFQTLLLFNKGDDVVVEPQNFLELFNLDLRLKFELVLVNPILESLQSNDLGEQIFACSLLDFLDNTGLYRAACDRSQIVGMILERVKLISQSSTDTGL